ncbi:hypothetical protein SAMN02799630_05266 [Paenibacillus sp. UNCCL117]|uniref:nucleotidyltransferase domain-containing protein n=1 Tax=unclassified Paenibacillus TaxID=185978 RepID=UPI0008884828|nr:MULTISPECIES: nucleotidyltransferase domain-containing protein [unclassified Paenibacillus]SDE36752.1 hypothetical protein SAMN04488602_12611 [Paenibacillus sp. cl123]SFW64807.1 hypothetical protein SAMN02799630_05266 [Paenibacillus sp. UNCCL117]
MRLAGEEAAKRFVQTHFPLCDGALLAGSVAQGGATEASDLDLVIFDESQDGPFRRTYRDFGWIIEVFVLTRESYRYFFDVAIESAIPSLLRMCACGVPLHGQAAISDILEEARSALAAGPPPWDIRELDKARYELSELAADLTGAEDRAECMFIAADLGRQLAVFALRTRCCWLGEGKWLVRSLRDCDAGASGKLVAALEAFYRNYHKSQLLTLAEEWLAPYGGPLTEGYAEGQEAEEDFFGRG